MSKSSENRGPNNVIRVPSSLDGSFFRHWVRFLKPLHNLSDREADITAAILKTRYDLSLKISDEELLDKIVLSEETKREIKDKCGISNPHFQVILSKLKKVGILKDNKLNKLFIPKIIPGEKSFSLMFYFELNDNKEGTI